MDSLGIGTDIDDAHGGDVVVVEIEGEENRADTPMPTIESGRGSCPPADEDRQVEPAPYHEQSQGGSTKSKREQSEIYVDHDCSGSSATALPLRQISAFRKEWLFEARS